MRSSPLPSGALLATIAVLALAAVVVVVRVLRHRGAQPEVRRRAGVELAASSPDRVLATVVFTDIVASTRHVAALGDREWRRLLDDHDRVTRQQLDCHRGSEVRHTGDGFLATFDSPARAVECISATMASLRARGIRLRAGVHTGEVELRGDGIDGIAVHIGARVCARAQPDEILVSQTVRDAAIGSPLRFTDRGRHELTGVPDAWQLYAARTSTPPFNAADQD